jgi:molybdopterin-binding protein
MDAENSIPGSGSVRIKKPTGSHPSGLFTRRIFILTQYPIPRFFSASLSASRRLSAPFFPPEVVKRSTRSDNTPMPLSARNQFPGKVVSIRKGAVMSEVVLDIGGGHQIVSLISVSSAKRLKLKKGRSAVAVIKATEVIISTDSPGLE